MGLGGLVILLALLYTLGPADEVPAPGALPAPASFGIPEDAGVPLEELAHSEAERALAERPIAPPDRAALPPAPSGPVSGCESDELDGPVDRPTISELIAERASELDDRVRSAMRRPDASPALRQGLLGALDPAQQAVALERIAAAPDRVIDGFDHLTAVVSVLAWQALTADDARRARELARYAERGAPSDALPLLVDALASEELGDEAGAQLALAEAFRLEPREPAVSLAYVRRLRHGVELETAVNAADAYVTDVPEDRQMARLLARLRMRRAAMHDGTVRRLRGISLLAPAAVETALTDRVLDLTDRALTESARLLGVPRRGALAVFVYRTHNELVTATCAQSWVAALYDGALHVDADRLGSAEETAISVRHEALHASLHDAIERAMPGGRPAHLPTWFDEGLAQYFANEEPFGARRSFALMVREHTYVPLPSMNGQFMVIDDPSDAGLAYHQALAMVLYLVDQRGERGIAAAVQYLREGGDPDALLSGVGAPLDGETLLAFLAQRLR
jgi:hypothetical protein